MSDPLTSGSGSPFSGDSIAPNFTTSQTNAQKINSTLSGSTFNAGTYIAGTGANLSSGGGFPMWGIITLGLAALGGLFWLIFGRKKKTANE